MPTRIRFYMDEHVPRAVTEGLRRRGIDVLTAQEASMLKASDQDHLVFAAKAGRVLFTQDTDFLRLHPTTLTHHGIVYAPQTMAIGRIVRGLLLIYSVLNAEDLLGHIEFL